MNSPSTRSGFFVSLAVFATNLPLAAIAQDLPNPDAAAALRGSASPGTPAAGASNLAMPPTRGIETIRSNETARTPEQAKALEQARAPSPAPDAKAQRAGVPEANATDFQLFVQTSVGNILPMFGHDLFVGGPSTFAPVDDLPAAADYPVGPGDEIVIRGWGQLDVDVHAIVTREGTINIPRVGVISVNGTRYQDLPTVIRKAVSRYYKNFELNVSLGRLRSIHVFVVGQARRPGLYTVGSLSTVMNALFASGGPLPTGSLRTIQLRRADKLVGEFDLYDLLLKGDKTRDQRLQSGDVIFIPPVGPVAAIAGKVKTPAIFELKRDSTLADLVDYAGGLTTMAATQSILVEHLDPALGRIEQEMPWTPESKATKLRDGDIVLLRALSQKFDNAVTLRGRVAFPLRTAWKKGLRVADLIPDPSFLIPESYWTRVATRSGETAPEPAQLKTKVDEVNWDYAVIERLNRSSLEPQLISFHLGKAVLAREPTQNLELEPGDIVTIFSRNDIVSPSEKHTVLVRIEGEVGTAGVYQVSRGETLRHLVRRAGGLTSKAYLFGAEFTRESVRREQQTRLEQVVARAEQELDRSATTRLARAATSDEAGAIRLQVEQQRKSLERLRTLKASGRMVLELDPEASAPDDLPDIALEDGDRLFVPFHYATVGVFGAVYTEGSFLYKADKDVNDYLEQAGGPTRGADDGSTYVLRADGSVFSKRQSRLFSSFGGRKLRPNDSIVVPEEFEPFSLIRELKDWSQIFYQFGLGLAALRILHT